MKENWRGNQVCTHLRFAEVDGMRLLLVDNYRRSGSHVWGGWCRRDMDARKEEVFTTAVAVVPRNLEARRGCTVWASQTSVGGAQAMT